MICETFQVIWKIIATAFFMAFNLGIGIFLLYVPQHNTLDSNVILCFNLSGSISLIQVGVLLIYLLFFYFCEMSLDRFDEVNYSVQFTASGVTLLNSVVLAIIACLDEDYKYFWAFAAIEFAFSATSCVTALAIMCDNLDCPDCTCEKMCETVNKHQFEDLIIIFNLLAGIMIA